MWSSTTGRAAVVSGERFEHLRHRHRRQKGAKTVDLTSRPSREAANRLYLKLGFQHRETNVYRFDLAD